MFFYYVSHWGARGMGPVGRCLTDVSCGVYGAVDVLLKRKSDSVKTWESILQS